MHKVNVKNDKNGRIYGSCSNIQIRNKKYESFEMVLRIHHLLLVAGYDPFAMFEDLTNYYGIDVGEFFKVDSLECRPTKMVKRHTIPLMVRSDLYHEAMVTGEVCNERKRQSYAI